MERADVLQRLEPIMKTQVRTIEANPTTRIRVTPEMVILQPGNKAHQLQVTEEGVKSLAKYTGMPAGVMRNLSRETLGTAFTELLARAERFSVLVDEGVVTGVARPTSVSVLNAEKALKSIEKGMRGAEYHRVLILKDNVVQLELVGEKREAVAKGDLIQAGAMVTFSPLGTVSPEVSSYALRLACTNGARSNTVIREWKYAGGGGGGGGEGDDIWQWFRVASAAAYNSLADIINRYREMMNENIPAADRAMMLEAMIREAKISGEDADAVRSMAIERPPENAYDLLNLLTYASSHIIEDPNRVRRAQLTSGDYTSEDSHSRVCPVCHATRN